MDELFINKFKHSKENIIEMNKAVTGVKFIVFRITVLIIMLLFSALWYFELHSLIGCIIVAIFGILFAVLPLIQLKYNASKNEKRLILLYNKIPEVISYFKEDFICLITEENKGDITIPYDKIIKIKQSKNLYLLIMKEKLVINVDKNRFEKGTCEEFERFITYKAVNAKNKL